VDFKVAWSPKVKDTWMDTRFHRHRTIGMRPYGLPSACGFRPAWGDAVRRAACSCVARLRRSC